MIEWLQTRVRGFECGVVMLGFLILQMSWMGFIYFIYALLDKPIVTDGFTVVLATSPSLLKILFIGAIIEETLFRLPIALTTLLKLPVWSSLLMAGLSSFVYGGVHPGFINNLMQSVSGMLLCLQFLKCGALQGNYWRALGSCIFTNMVMKILKAGILLYLLSLRG